MPPAESSSGSPAGFLHRLQQATNDHDVEAIAACFSVEYCNQTPAHPSRGFCGQDQVRRNWQQILEAVPDVTAEVLEYVVDGQTVWSEWEHRGTRRDGATHLMRGVVIFVVAGGLGESARFYLEPVQHDGTDADAAVHRHVGAATP